MKGQGAVRGAARGDQINVRGMAEDGDELHQKLESLLKEMQKLEDLENGELSDENIKLNAEKINEAMNKWFMLNRFWLNINWQILCFDFSFLKNIDADIYYYNIFVL